MSDASTIEVASVGSEGIVGVPILGGRLSAGPYLQVSHGTVQYMALNVFESFCHDSELGRAVDRFCGTFMKSVMQLIACNRLHPMEERCARWILWTHERLGRAQFELTQPFLGMAIAAPPEELSSFMVRLADERILRYDAATVTLLDPIALRRLACSCYGALKKNAATERVRQSRNRVQAVNVVRMQPTTMCTLCGLMRDAPHKSHVECLRAIDAELRTLMARVKQLTGLRRQLADESIQKFENFLTPRQHS